MTAKELKNHTGAALRAVERGQKVVLTRRGKPVAVMLAAGAQAPEDAPTFEEIWPEIERALATTKPHHRSWQQAMAATRRRR